MSQQKDIVQSLINQALAAVNINDILGSVSGVISSLPPAVQQGLGAIIGSIFGKRSLDLQSLLPLVQSVLSSLPSQVSFILQAIINAALNHRALDFQVALQLLAPYIEGLLDLVPSWILPVVSSVISDPSSILNFLPLLINFLPAEAQSIAATIIGLVGKRGLEDLFSQLLTLAISQVPPQYLNIVTALLGGKRSIDLSSLVALVAPYLQSAISQFSPQFVQLVTSILSGKRGLELSSLLALAAPYLQSVISQFSPELVQFVTSLLSGKRGLDLSSIAPVLLNLISSSGVLAHLSAQVALLPESLQSLINLGLSAIAPALLG